ncbi:MAG: peroxiredoxin [Flavobacteriales bacterium]|nr:peroxiredoxin [Flavobacteriales bacterium]
MLELRTPAPDFELLDQDGEPVRLSSFRGQHNVVLFFYPKDNTRICTLEVCAFRDAHPAMTDQDAVVFGISSDPVGSHHSFSQRWKLPYRLLSDTDGAVRNAYRVNRTLGLFPGRVTYVIDHEGIIRGAVNDPLSASRHVREALDLLKAQSTS